MEWTIRVVTAIIHPINCALLGLHHVGAISSTFASSLLGPFITMGRYCVIISLLNAAVLTPQMCRHFTGHS